MFHYVYRITNIIKKLHYYGKRSSKYSPKDDIGIKYFSSSSDKKFIEDQKLNPQNYKYKVVKTFDTRNDAILFESLLHKKFNVKINEHFLNRANQNPNGFFGDYVRTDEIKNKISSTLREKYNSGELIHSKGMSCKSHSEKTKNKMSLIRKGVPKPKVQCPYCNKEGQAANMKRFHFDNCPTKTGISHKLDTILCPHCGKEGALLTMKRWHFDNCKLL